MLTSVAARAYLVLVLALAACALVPILSGMSATTVSGTSMEPHIVTGDVALSTIFDRSTKVPLGRVISFEAPPGSGRTGLILHRIVAIDSDGGLITAGDGNAQVDTWTLQKSDIVSVAHLLIPRVGLPAVWIENRNFGALATWIAVTAAAIGLEIAAVGAEGSHRRSLPRHRQVALHGLAAMAIPLSMLAAFGTADAAFTGTTTSVGNTWSAATSAPATKLVFSRGPSSSTGGVAFGTQPVVTVRNAAGDLKTGTRTISLALSTSAGASLACSSNPLMTATGTATFAGCAVDRAGTYTLTATSGTLTSAVSTSFRITAGAPARLVFSASPSRSSVGAMFTTQPTVSVTDAGGNISTTSVPVTLKLTTAGSAKLSCTRNPVSSSSGSAAFTGCRVDRSGTYTFTATSSGLTAAVSSTLVVM